MADKAAEPHVSVDKRGHAVVNGKNVRVRDVLELLLTYRSLDDVASKLQIEVEFVEAAVFYAVAQVK